jgi:hypothetical protein
MISFSIQKLSYFVLGCDPKDPEFALIRLVGYKGME